MKQRLKLHLWRTNSTVHMQILEQEGITKNLSDKIRINKEPELFGFNINLRGGWQNRTDYISNCPFDSEQYAINYINEVISWLDDVFPAREPKQGDMVKVKEYENDKWEERMYVSSFVNEYTGKTHYVCVYEGDESDFIKGECCEILDWLYMQPISSNWNEETGIYEAEREI